MNPQHGIFAVAALVLMVMVLHLLQLSRTSKQAFTFFAIHYSSFIVSVFFAPVVHTFVFLFVPVLTFPVYLAWLKENRIHAWRVGSSLLLLVSIVSPDFLKEISHLHELLWFYFVSPAVFILPLYVVLIMFRND